MKLSDITIILATAELAPLSREQLLELAGTHAGKQFQAALLGFANGDHRRRNEIEATVRALDPSVRSTLRLIGSTSTVDQMVAAACREQRRFFDAVDAIAARTDRATAARRYLVDLGIAPAAPATTSSSPVEPVAPPYYSFKIFSSAAALCIAEATTKADRKQTINIEGAAVLSGGAGGRRTYDWPNKIVVQLTVQEAYQVLALLENKLRSLKFDGHGFAHDKSLQLEFQDSHYFFRLVQRGRSAIAVPVRAVDAIPIVSLLYKQLLANEPHLSVSHLQAMTDRLANMTLAGLPTARP
jgi:hypothetical protein